MNIPKIFESEYRFCLILWEVEPINSTKLAALCKEQLGWSKATTYTVIRRLSDRGVAELDEFVEKTFEGSLPAFIAAFSRSKKLSDKEIAQLQEMIDQYKG